MACPTSPVLSSGSGSNPFTRGIGEADREAGAGDSEITSFYQPKLSPRGIGGLTFLKTDSELRAHSAKAITKCSGRSADSHSATAEPIDSKKIQKNYLDWLLSPAKLDIDDKAKNSEGFANGSFTA